MSLEVSVVIPCLNEAQTLTACIRKARQALDADQLAGEIIVADNGSTDGSDRLAEAAGARLVRVSLRGYGAGLMGGIAAAQGTYIVMGDADDSYDFSAIAPLIKKLREGHALVMGCRFPSGGGRIMPGAMPWSHRWIGNPILTGLGKLFFRAPISDFHCGLRAFRRDAILALDLRTTGMEFASEMVVKATLKKLRIAEVPITLYKDGRLHPPHLRSWRDGWRHLRFLLLYSPRWLFLVPGGLLLALGSMGALLLLVGPVQVGPVGFDTNSLLVACAGIVIGLKLIAFSVFAKVFAMSEGLLPEDRRLTALFRAVTLETGLVGGGLLTAVGLALLAWGTLSWQAHGFGTLSYPQSLRIVIPGVTVLILGVEIICSSFFLSILGLRRK